MHRIQHFGGLLDHGNGCAYRRISAAFANLLFRRATNPHTGRGHVLNQLHQGRRWRLVGQFHNGITQRHAAGLDQGAAARRHTENVGVLTCASVGHQETWEVVEHPRV